MKNIILIFIGFAAVTLIVISIKQNRIIEANKRIETLLISIDSTLKAQKQLP